MRLGRLGVPLALAVAVLVGCSARFTQELKLTRPVHYERAFNAALKAASDLGYTPYFVNKDAGTLTASQASLGGAQEVSIIIDKGAQQVERVRITGEVAGRMLPPSQSEVAEVVSSYARTLRKYLE